MIKSKSIFLLIFILFLSVKGTFSQTINGQRWKNHFINDLLPFWNMPEALGNPIGNFPTYRCNDGRITNCPEMNVSQAAPWIVAQTDSFKRDFIRTKSRQTFFYGVAYHLTGNDTFLYYAQCGVNFIRNQIRKSGLIYPYYSNTQNMPVNIDSIHVTTQDLAGALNGLSFYYYLTHDTAVFNDILRVKDYVFKYYSEPDGYLKWTLCPDTTCSENKTDLASFLDQVNNYLLLITPLIDDKKVRETCISNLKTFCNFMQQPLFFNNQNNMIWAKTKCKSCLGSEYNDPLRKVGARTHTDYGQTARTYWNLFLAGKLINDTVTCEFAYKNGIKTINNAFLPNEQGAWALSPFESETRSWWLHAELDQATALFSLTDTLLNNKIAKPSNTFWFNNFVDKKFQEVYSDLDKYNKPLNSPKIYHWKNAYHTAEHALFGYIVSSNFNNEVIELYYGYNKKSLKKENTAKPFYFGGEIENIAYLNWSNSNLLNNTFKKEHSKTKIGFVNIKAGNGI
jgi:hypothetical protein